MPSKRQLIVLAVTVIAESVWLFPVLGMLGFLLEQGGSPLPLYFMILLSGSAAVVSFTILKKRRNIANPAIAQALFGLISIYFGMAFLAPGGGADFLWGLRVIGGGYSGRELASVIIGSAMAGLLWNRGVRIAVDSHPRERLLFTFRAGIIGLAVSMLGEQLFDADFAATVMFIPFFVICLAALAFARMASSGIWHRAIGLTVAVVLGGGMVLGLAGALFGGNGLMLLVAGWNRFLEWVSWILMVVLAPVLEVIFGFIIWLIGETEPRSRAERVVTPREYAWWENIETGGVPPFVEFVVQLLKYPLLLLSIYLLYRLLLWAYRVHVARALAIATVDRESIRGNANAAADFINLALGMLPDWMLPVGMGRKFRYPKDKPGISEVYALYFEMLAVARKHGHAFEPSATPREREPELERAVPEAPVARITDCFNAACYGNIATDREMLETLKSELEAVT